MEQLILDALPKHKNDSKFYMIVIVKYWHSANRENLFLLNYSHLWWGANMLLQYRES